MVDHVVIRMLVLYKTLLAPALLAQGRHLRKTALRLPEAAGDKSGVIAGPVAQPLRLLFVGDSSAAGVGVEWQHEALAQQAAETVARESGRCVRWHLIAKSGASTRDAAELVKLHARERADVVITALGVNDVTSQVGARRFVADYKALLSVVAQRTGANAAVVSGLPPLHDLPAAPQPLRWYLGQCAKRLDAALQGLCEAHPNARFVSLAWANPSEMARDKFHPGKGQYKHWAELVALQVVAVVQRGAASAHAPASGHRPADPGSGSC